MLKSFFRTLTVLLMSVMFLFLGTYRADASSTSPTKDISSPIIDEGSMFSSAEEASLTETVVGNHEKYGLLFAIETVPSLDGQSVESVALAHARTLGVGEAGKDNGVFILLSRDDRKIRFELGKGVSAKISDSEMTNIISSIVTPHFKAGNYMSGLESGMTTVGNKYIGNPATADFENQLKSLLIVGVIIFLVIVSIFIARQVGGQSAKDHKTYQNHNKAIARLRMIESNVRDFKRSESIDAYKALPNEQARLESLQINLPELASLLQKHYSSDSPSTNLVDRALYTDVGTFAVSYAGNWSNSPVKMYKLFGKGFESISINDANKLIQIEKDIYLKQQSDRRKIQEQEQKEREKARKIWNSLPESTRQAVKKAKTKEDRMILFASDEIPRNFITHYPLIASMFLSNSTSSSSAPSSSHSSNSSRSSYSPPSSYDSGSYGGGSFDGGGGSGSW